MFRSLSDVLNIDIDQTKTLNLSEKERFVFGIKLICRSPEPNIGFIILNSIKGIDTCSFVNPSFVEELLSSNSKSGSVNFGSSLKIIQFILANASHTESFEMAIHQHMAQQASNPDVITATSLEELLQIIEVIENYNYKLKIPEEYLKKTCTRLVAEISKAPSSRDSQDIKAQNIKVVKIVAFFRSLTDFPYYESLKATVLSSVIERISSSDAVSPLTYLGLAVVPDQMIKKAVAHILNVSGSKSQKQSIVLTLRRLIQWQYTTMYDVPLHEWVTTVLLALYNENHYDILENVILESINQCVSRLIIPIFQVKTFKVIEIMLEVQRSEDIFKKLVPGLLGVLKNLSEKPNVIFEPFMNVLVDYISNFNCAYAVCKDVIDFLESHHRPIDRNISKYHRLSCARSSISNGKVGLQNLGNTCYINSVLQALCMTKIFCKELLRMERDDQATRTIQKIFALLHFSGRSELNLKFAMQYIRPFEFIAGLQHDSSEFMGSLLDKLHEADKKYLNNINKSSIESEATSSVVNDENKSMQDVSMNMESDGIIFDYGTMHKTVDNTSELNQSTIVQKVFGGKISTTCVCSACNSKSISVDSFRDLALSFPQKEENEDDWDAASKYSVQELLDYYFLSENLTLDGDNQYHCDKCKILCDGVRYTELLQSPKNLILTLKHFCYDSRYHTRSKLHINKMSHDEVIKVNVVVGEEVRTVNYKLYAAVVHSGISLDSGHYYTFARDNNEVWYKFNDNYVSTTHDRELHSLNSPNTPYILFYRRISTASATPSSSTASNDIQVMNEDQSPSFEDLPLFLKKFIKEENEAFEKESKKLKFQPLREIAKKDRWNDDDPNDDPPPNCGGNFNLQYNRFIL